MEEERIFFTGGNVDIEGLYGSNDGRRGVVVTHPHSLKGGTMMNNVVNALVTTFYRNGFSTLRFNFRGVGHSGGIFDNGMGEQDDVRGALAFLADKGKDSIVLAGYSFGAWVNAKLFPGLDHLSDVIMVSPPIDFVPFDFSGVKDRCGLIICGDRDQFCPIDDLKRIVKDMDCRLNIVDGADHFYFGREQGIQDHLNAYLEGKES